MQHKLQTLLCSIVGKSCYVDWPWGIIDQTNKLSFTLRLLEYHRNDASLYIPIIWQIYNTIYCLFYTNKFIHAFLHCQANKALVLSFSHQTISRRQEYCELKIIFTQKKKILCFLQGYNLLVYHTGFIALQTVAPSVITAIRKKKKDSWEADIPWAPTDNPCLLRTRKFFEVFTRSRYWPLSKAK
jgi:hypothetical protein